MNIKRFVKRATPFRSISRPQYALVFLLLFSCRSVAATDSIFIPPGSPLPEIEATIFDSGESLIWDKYKGKVVVLQTFATWCPPCKKALPHYDKVAAALADKGVIFIALSFDASLVQYKAWMEQNRSKFHATFARVNVPEDDKRGSATLKRFRGSLPGFYIVGRDGRVVVGYRSFNEQWANNPQLDLNEDQRLILGLRAAGVELDWEDYKAIRGPEEKIAVDRTNAAGG